MSLDGSTMAVADTPENEKAFGRPSSNRGRSAFPMVRFLSLVENGTHVLCGTQMADYKTSEIALAKHIIRLFRPGMLILADRGFFGYELWRQALETGADLLWRVQKNLTLPCEKRLSDGSYLSHIYPSPRHRRHRLSGIQFA